MRNILNLSLSTFLILIFTGCIEENKKYDSGGDSSTYSSCKITSSDAMPLSQRRKDESQCWDAMYGYSDIGEAMKWCDDELISYHKRQRGAAVHYHITIHKTACK